MVSNTEPDRGYHDQRLSIAGVGVVPDILSTLGQLDAIVPRIWLPSPTLQVTSSTFGHERKIWWAIVGKTIVRIEGIFVPSNARLNFVVISW